EDSLADSLGGDVRDADLTAELARPPLGVTRDARQQRPVGARHLDPLTQGALRSHLDDAEQGATRVLGIEERRDSLENRPGPGRVRRRDKDAIVAHVGGERRGTKWYLCVR